MDNWTRSFIITVFTVEIFVNNNKTQLDRTTQWLLEVVLHILLHLFYHVNFVDISKLCGRFRFKWNLVPWHLQLSLSTQAQFLFDHHLCGVPCRLGSPVALSSSLLVHWDVCSCSEQLKEKTHVCPWNGKKKKKKLDWVKGIVFWPRGHAELKDAERCMRGR